MSQLGHYLHQSSGIGQDERQTADKVSWLSVIWIPSAKSENKYSIPYQKSWRTHTCIEKPIEFLIWNVSCVQTNNRRSTRQKSKFKSSLAFWNGLKLMFHGQIAKTVQKTGNGMEIIKATGRFSAFSRLLCRWSRYVELIRLHITTNWQCLRWAVTVSRALPPCWKQDFWKSDYILKQCKSSFGYKFDYFMAYL